MVSNTCCDNNCLDNYCSVRYHTGMSQDTISSSGEAGPRPTASGVPPLIFQITRELRTTLDRRMAPYGLTFPQASLLIRCVRNPGASPNQLMPQLGTDTAGVSRLVDRLEARNLVVRRTSGSDRRSIALEATAAGAALAPELEQVMGGVDRQLVAGLSDEEVTQLGELLRRMLANARKLERP